MKMLHDLASEADESTFREKLSDFLAIKYDHYKSCISYFESTYVKDVWHWAYCYRIRTGFNTNMPLETFHKILKYIHGNGKTIKSVYSALQIIEGTLIYKLHSVICETLKPRVTHKLRLMRRAHDMTVKYLQSGGNQHTIENVTECSWSITSFPTSKRTKKNDGEDNTDDTEEHSDSYRGQRQKMYIDNRRGHELSPKTHSCTKKDRLFWIYISKIGFACFLKL